jgi:anthranilate phosphoribosyltransferase
MISEATKRLIAGETLAETEVEEVAGEMMSGDATPVQIAAFLTAQAIRGERIPEIVAFARALRARALPFRRPEGIVIDTCGTGGDHSGTFNISTAAALVAAGAGVRVAKHGNRGASSRCGSADVLQELGVRLDAPPEVMERALAEASICFLFAQHYHQSMRHVGPVRRELGFRTVFNLVGPLSNPAGASRQLIGVFRSELVETYAGALAQLGCEGGMVVHGEDGLDEISTTSPTVVATVVGGGVKVSRMAPEDFGMARARREDLAGGEAPENAAIIRAILAGEPGPKADIVLLNAGAAIHVAGAAPSVAAGVEAARRAIAGGEAARRLDALVRVTNA